MSFRNPSPPLGYNSEPASQPNATVAPIILRLVENIVGGKIDGQSTDSIEDTPLERTLCAAWDLASIDEYAVAMLEDGIQVVILKVCSEIDTIYVRITRSRSCAIARCVPRRNDHGRASWRSAHWLTSLPIKKPVPFCLSIMTFWVWLTLFSGMKMMLECCMKLHGMSNRLYMRYLDGIRSDT
jgi:hypothetical protein